MPVVIFLDQVQLQWSQLPFWPKEVDIIKRHFLVEDLWPTRPSSRSCTSSWWSLFPIYSPYFLLVLSPFWVETCGFLAWSTYTLNMTFEFLLSSMGFSFTFHSHSGDGNRAVFQNRTWRCWFSNWSKTPDGPWAPTLQVYWLCRSSAESLHRSPFTESVSSSWILGD